MAVTYHGPSHPYEPGENWVATKFGSMTLLCVHCGGFKSAKQHDTPPHAFVDSGKKSKAGKPKCDCGKTMAAECHHAYLSDLAQSSLIDPTPGPLPPCNNFEVDYVTTSADSVLNEAAGVAICKCGVSHKGHLKKPAAPEPSYYGAQGKHQFLQGSWDGPYYWDSSLTHQDAEDENWGSDFKNIEQDVEWVQVAVMIKRKGKEPQVVILKAKLTTTSVFSFAADYAMEEPGDFFGDIVTAHQSSTKLHNFVIRIKNAFLKDPE